MSPCEHPSLFARATTQITAEVCRIKCTRKSKEQKAGTLTSGCADIPNNNALKIAPLYYV